MAEAIRQQHHFEERRERMSANGDETWLVYRCTHCNQGTRFPEMYDTDQGWREQPSASPFRIVGGFHGCDDTRAGVQPG